MTYAGKSSKGRSTRAPAKVPDVETLPCKTGTHRLTNIVVFREAVTICEQCRKTWGEIDEQARERAGRVA